MFEIDQGDESNDETLDETKIVAKIECVQPFKNEK